MALVSAEKSMGRDGVRPWFSSNGQAQAATWRMQGHEEQSCDLAASPVTPQSVL
jgi:hypothetical protein